MSEAVEARGHLRTRARLATWLSLPTVRARLAVGALAAVAVIYLLPAPGVGWNQGAHYALVRALADGTPRIDRTQHEVGGGGTGDVSFIHGHYYAAKSPGLAFAALTPYLAMKAAGRADPVRDATGQVWFLTIWGAVLPALLLLVLVRFVAERLEPGFGALAALMLGLTTMILPFATMFFSHALSATLAFSAFTVLWWERRAPPRLALVFCAGLVAGLAATTEFPVAVIGAILGLYGIARAGVARRLVAYATGACLGGLPTLLFNLWAFGHAFKFPYANVIQSGTNKTGLFGITTPKFHVLVEVLFAPSGLLTLTPIVLVGAIGLGFLYQRGHRAEALVAGAIAFVYFLINAGYESPFGGNSPGPRFLVAVMPFLALGFGAALRRFPLTATALAVGSAVEMVVLTLTNPQLTDDGAWFHRFAQGRFLETSLDLAGLHHVGVTLFFVALGAATVLVVLTCARPQVSWRDALMAPLAVGGWIFVARRASDLLEKSGHSFVDGCRARRSRHLVVVLAPLLALLAPRARALGRSS
jgi:hypothetical protein